MDTPFSSTQLIKKYFQYYFRSFTKHDIHSPFLFDFLVNVLNDKQSKPEYRRIELIRKKLLANGTNIEVHDFGAGSRVHDQKQRTISNIAKASLSPAKFSKLLFRVIQYYHCNTMLELGTSLGISTAYMALANPSAKITTIEGAESIYEVSKNVFKELGISYVKSVYGTFDEHLQSELKQLKKVDLAFIDGNHTYKNTLAYFDEILPYCHNNSILIFDDINWSTGMERAWREIVKLPVVTQSVDLFNWGIVFLRKELTKQHFVIRF